MAAGPVPAGFACRGHRAAARREQEGVYRAAFADGLTVVLYVWADSESFWPSTADEPSGPESSALADACGPDLFLAANDALCRLDIRTPSLLASDPTGASYPAALAVVEDMTGGDLQTALTQGSERASRAVDELGDILARMHAVKSEAIGKLGITSASTGSCERLAWARATSDLVQAPLRRPLPAAVSDLTRRAPASPLHPVPAPIPHHWAAAPPY